MKNWKRFLALLLSLAMALSLCACGSGGAGPSGEPSASPSGSPDPAASGQPDPSATPAIDVDLTQDVLAFSAGMSAGDRALTVNGEDAPADLFLYILAMNCSQVAMYAPLMGTSLEEMAPELLDDSVSVSAAQLLLRQKAEELGCLPTDAQREEIRANLEQADPDTVSRYWGLSDGTLELLLSTNTYYNNLLEVLTHEPGEQELAGYLTEQGVFRVKHILLMTVDQATQEALPDDQVAAKKAAAEDLLSQLQGVGADGLEAKFDELMKAHSEDSGLESNPDGYVFDSADSLVGGFREAALELAEGELSGIVETDYGYHIMLRLPLADESVAGYRENFRSSAMDKLMEQWQGEADITRADALSGLDAADFYNRISAYQQALQAQEAPAESGAVG